MCFFVYDPGRFIDTAVIIGYGGGSAAAGRGHWPGEVSSASLQSSAIHDQ